jgi:hypothetical protein
MTPGQQERNRKGGLARAAKYSHEQIVNWCKLGGRPRNLDIDELRALRLEENNI